MKPALLVLILILATLVWNAAGGRPQHWDSAIHMTESLNASRIGEDSTSSLMRQALFVSWYYPPFVSYASVPLYAIFGESERTGLLVMTFFLVVLVVATYALGARLFHEEAGLIAAVLMASLPVVVEFSHTLMLDLPLAAMVAAAAVFLLRSENFSRIPCSLLAGFVFGCGLLTKWTFPLFLLGPGLLAFAGALKADGKRRRRLWTLAASASIAILVALPWYLVHAVQIISSRGGELRQEEITGLGSLVAYVAMMPLQTSWILLPVLAAGIVAFAFRVRTHALFLIVWFATAYLLISLIGFKLPRFSISLFVPLTLMASAGLSSMLKPQAARALLFVLCGVVFLSAAFVPAESAPGRFLAQPVYGEPLLKTDGPGSDGWHQRAIAERIAADARSRGAGQVNLRVVPDLVYCNSSTLAYQAKLLRLPMNVAGISAYPLFTDYVLVTSGRVSDAGAAEERRALTGRVLRAGGSIYAEVARWALPDSNQAILLRVDPQPDRSVSASAVVEALRASADQFVRRYLRSHGKTGLEIVEYSPDETRRGKIREMRIASEQAELGDFAFTSTGLRVRNVEIVLRDLQIDVHALIGEGRLDVYAMRGAEFRRLSVSGEDLAAYAGRSADLTVGELAIEDGAIELQVTPKEFGRQVRLRIALETVAGRDVAFTIERLSVGGIPIPAAVVNTMLSPFTPLLSGLRSIPEVRLGTLVLDNNLMELRQP